MAATTVFRPQHKLGDFLFAPDLQKFQSDETNVRPWMFNPIVTAEHELQNNQTYINKNLKTEFVKNLLGENYYYSSSTTPSCSNEGTFNENYAKQTNMKEQKNEGKKFKKCIKSSKSKPRGKSSKKPSIVPMSMELEEDTIQDKMKFLNLQQEIEKEQEYQNQINMIYNNPEYFEHYSNHLEYQQELHHFVQDDQQVILDPQIMQQYPPMYFVVQPSELHHHHHQPQYLPGFDENTFEPVAMSTTCSTPIMSVTSLDTIAETSSDYYSDSASCSSDCSVCSDDEIQDMSSSLDLGFNYNIYTTTTTSPVDYHCIEEEVPFELDEELNNLVLSIISD